MMNKTLQNISDLLSEQLCENRKTGKEIAVLKCTGRDPDNGELMELIVCLRGVKE